MTLPIHMHSTASIQAIPWHCYIMIKPNNYILWLSYHLWFLLLFLMVAVVGKASRSNAIVEVFPLTDIDRSRPVLGGNRSLFTIRRLEDPPDRLFRVSRRNIVKFELFHELLLAKSRAMVAEQDVDGAFPYLARLVNDFPRLIAVNIDIIDGIDVERY